MNLMEEIEKYLNSYGIESVYETSDFVAFEDNGIAVIANVQETDDFSDVADVSRETFESVLLDCVDKFNDLDVQPFRFDQLLARRVNESNTVIRHQTGLYGTDTD